MNITKTAMITVCGRPNVGKSSLTNALVGEKIAIVSKKPQTTRNRIYGVVNRGDTQFVLLDTPGLLWPRFDDPDVGIRLALAGSVSDEVLNLTELAETGILFMREHYPGQLRERYGEWPEGAQPWEMLSRIAESRKALKKGGEPDTEKAARLFIDDLRSGRLGRITFEAPPENQLTI